MRTSDFDYELPEELIAQEPSQVRGADRMLVLSKGTVIMQGAPREVFSRSAELVRLGLDVPEAEKIAYRLRKLGVNVSEDIYTNAQLIEELKALKGGASHA